MAGTVTDPALTHTLTEFIEMKSGDNYTYRNFSILDQINGMECLDHNLLDDYLDELKSLCQEVTLNQEEYAKYKYSPDLLAYDVYGSVQLDFVILFANGMIDPKEFNRKTIKLPYASIMSKLLTQIYNAEQVYLNYNRSQLGISSNIF